jgi:hypothetical protein
MSMDAKKLKEALNEARNSGGQAVLGSSLYRYVRQCDLDALLAAAEAHLQTLPETEQRWFVTWWSCGASHVNTFGSLQRANLEASLLKNQRCSAVHVSGPFEVPA